MANILIYTPNVIGQLMAGPAIRCWEFAKALSRKHQVTLITPNSSELKNPNFTIISRHSPLYHQHFRQANVLITQFLTCSMALQAKRYQIKIIIDAYDPIPLESLEQFKQAPLSIRNEHQFSSINNLVFNFKMADSIICASEKQRDLWIGFLLGHKLITPFHYDQESSLRHLIDVVPFGLSCSKPIKTGPGLREKYGFVKEDKIVLWGGGIWNWFDPLSLIKAFKKLESTRQDIKLVFMGIKNPDPSVPLMAMTHKAIQLAKQLDLLDETVFFNSEWVPYEERHNYLLDATLGVSIHFDHLETRYAFRTRMLDYIWTQLPILATTGDSFAELIENSHLGKIVPYEDEQTIASAILSLVDNPSQLQTIKTNLGNIQKHFYWDQVIEPIHYMIDLFNQQPSHSLHTKDIKTLTRYIFTQVREKGLGKSLEILIRKLNKRFKN